MSAAIRVEGLKKSYGSAEVLKGLTFEVEKGSIFALLGVNGAGKTTALECMEGLKKQDGGSVIIEGRKGIQLQSATLPSHIKALEAVKMFAYWNKAEADMKMLKDLGIEKIEKKKYYQLSTGQKRRLHLALALLSNPDVIFLDEPTAGLDVEGRSCLHGQIRELKKEEKTVVLASHDMAEVEALCDCIGILREGKLAFYGTAEQLNEKLGRRHNIKIKTSEGEQSMETTNIGETLYTILADCRKRGVEVLDVKADRGSLEQHFINIAGGQDI